MRPYECTYTVLGVDIVMSTEWHERERARFDDGTYKPIPVALSYPAEHFVHLSVTETEIDTVAYTPSDEYGARDRQVRLKFGRYLHKTFTDLTDAEIQSYVIELKSALSIELSAPTLHFATDRATINDIFETRMYACGITYKSFLHGTFDGDTGRPYHVYADSPDVQVAYVIANGNIRSRSVVSVKDKIWVRAYSVADGDNDADCGALKQLLKDAGYSKGDLCGNRLTKLDTGDVMLPYVDNAGAMVRDNGEYWTVVADEDEADYTCDRTDGTARSVNRCEDCGNRRNDCECYVCECCNERSPDGCEECSICEECSRCTQHDGCNCNRCSECNEIIMRPRHRYITSCNCDRCSECGELDDECNCDKCDECGCLETDCECEDESEESEDETETVTVAVADEEAA